eukprot:13705825-Alexandrium_andersonii.AAC.1
MSASLVGSEMCIRDSSRPRSRILCRRGRSRPTATASGSTPRATGSRALGGGAERGRRPRAAEAAGAPAISRYGGRHHGRA